MALHYPRRGLLAPPMENDVLSSQEALSGSGPPTTGRLSTLLPRKRRATDSDGTTGAEDTASDAVEVILVLAGDSKELPASLNHEGVLQNFVDKTVVLNKTRSSAWAFLDLYKVQEGEVEEKDILSLCVI